MNVIKNIKLFGDSILKGIQINPANNRYRVDNHIDVDAISQKYSLSIENHSKFGCTISKGIQIIQERLKLGELCDTVVMDFGGNDCDFDWRAISERPFDEHKPNTPLDQFIESYHRVIDMLKENGIRPILTTLPPLAPQKFFNWFCRGLNKENVMKWLGEVNAIYRFQEKYSRAAEAIARIANVPVIDLRGVFLRDRHLEPLLCEDGTHPNTQGQRAMTSAFFEFADEIRAALASAKQKNCFA